MARIETWQTLQNASRIRKQTIECQVDPDDSENLPVIFYHRKCYQYFTMKSVLTKIEEERIKQFEALKARSEAIVSYEEKVEERSTRSSESVLRDNNQTVLPKMCIFCKRNKYVKRRLEKLIQCVELRAVESIREAAKGSDNYDLISLASKDLVAAEAHYHASCYKSFTLKPQSENKSSAQSTENAIYKEVQLESFKLLAEYMHEEIAKDNILCYSNLLTKMEELMSARGEEMKKPAKLFLRRNIDKHFKDVDSINIDNKTYFYRNTLTQKSLVENNIKLKSEIDSLNKRVKELEELSIIERCGHLIQKDITKMKDRLPWPPRPQDLDPQKLPLSRKS